MKFNLYQVTKLSIWNNVNHVFVKCVVAILNRIYWCTCDLDVMPMWCSKMHVYLDISELWLTSFYLFMKFVALMYSLLYVHDESQCTTNRFVRVPTTTNDRTPEMRGYSRVAQGQPADSYFIVQFDIFFLNKPTHARWKLWLTCHRLRVTSVEGTTSNATTQLTSFQLSWQYKLTATFWYWSYYLWA